MKTSGSSPHAGHRARMRMRYHETGLAGFQPHEILELILFSAIPKRDVNPLAHELMNRFGSLGGVLQASEEELLSVPGVGKHTSELLHALRDVMKDYHRLRNAGTRTIRDVVEAIHYARWYGHHSYSPEMIVLMEDHAGTLMTGAIFPITFHTQDVTRAILASILERNTHSVILVCKGFGPLRKLNKSDLIKMSALVSLLNAVDVYTLDFILISGEYIYSLRNAGLLTDKFRVYRENMPVWQYWTVPLRDYPVLHDWHHVPPDKSRL